MYHVYIPEPTYVTLVFHVPVYYKYRLRTQNTNIAQKCIVLIVIDDLSLLPKPDSAQLVLGLFLRLVERTVVLMNRR